MDSSRALSRACRSLTLVVATAALALGVSGVVLAGTTNVSNNTVTYTGGPGEYNTVRAGYDTTSPNGPWIVVQEQNVNYTNDHGPNCTNANPSNTSITDPQTVWCPAGGVTLVVLNGADKDDSLSVGSFGNASSVFPKEIGFNFDGGDGNDG